jgi:hypothetical protein
MLPVGDVKPVRSVTRRSDGGMVEPGTVVVGLTGSEGMLRCGLTVPGLVVVVVAFFAVVLDEIASVVSVVVDFSSLDFDVIDDDDSLPPPHDAKRRTAPTRRATAVRARRWLITTDRTAREVVVIALAAVGLGGSPRSRGSLTG